MLLDLDRRVYLVVHAAVDVSLNEGIHIGGAVDAVDVLLEAFVILNHLSPLLHALRCGDPVPIYHGIECLGVSSLLDAL